MKHGTQDLWKQLLLLDQLSCKILCENRAAWVRMEELQEKVGSVEEGST